MMEKDFKEHTCKALPANGVAVTFSCYGLDNSESSWNLIIRREAGIKDLEKNHYLSDVGETIWETIVEISHCPYCGENLYGKPPASVGRFTHRDYSGWSVKVE